MKKHLETTCTSLIVAVVTLIGPRYVSAHIIDERPGLGKGMIIALSIFWAAVVVGIVFLVRRLIRPRQGVRQGRGDDKGNKEKLSREKD